MSATEWLDRVDAVRAGLVDRRDTPEGMGQAYALATAVLPRALAALRGVLDGHEPAPGPFGSYRQACAECSDPEVGLTVFYPCATVRAIEEALA